MSQDKFRPAILSFVLVGAAANLPMAHAAAVVFHVAAAEIARPETTKPHSARRSERTAKQPKAGQQKWLNPQPEPPLPQQGPTWLNPQPEPPAPPKPEPTHH